MATRIAINGEVKDSESATISVLDRGFLYGDSVYEVMRTYGGRIFAGRPHLERLAHSANLLEMVIPLPAEQLLAEIEMCVSAAGNEESYVRVIVTRGAGPIGLDPALAEQPCRVVIVTDLKVPPPALYTAGVKVSLIDIGRSAESALFAGAKSGNYLTNLLALRQASKHGSHEALLVDTHGRICEGSTSNVFAVIDGVICTPPLEVGILEGITRREVIALARGLGYALEERQLTPPELLSADEILLTSTLREVMPVVQVDDALIGAGVPGPITQALRQAFTEVVTGPQSHTL